MNRKMYRNSRGLGVYSAEAFLGVGLMKFIHMISFFTARLSLSIGRMKMTSVSEFPAMLDLQVFHWSIFCKRYGFGFLIPVMSSGGLLDSDASVKRNTRYTAKFMTTGTLAWLVMNGATSAAGS